MKNIILCLISLSFVMADIHISGDARVRPRYDIKENGDGSSTSDLYYLYRARLNVKADIGEGWFFNTQLGTNSVAGMTRLGTLNGDESFSFNPSLSFMELYFGSMKDGWGFWGGAFPLKYSPALDLHFYSDKLVDIPFVLFSNGSVGGFAGYRAIAGHKLNWFLSVDDDVVDSEEFSDDTAPIDSCDYYTLGLDASFKISSISITPRLLTSFGGAEDDIAPTTFGADFILPEFAGFSSSISYYSSLKGTEEDDGHYEADHLRLSFTRPIKDGKLKFFYDMAKKNDDEVSFIWLSYTRTLYKGEMGEVTISPTFRLQNGKNAGLDTFDADYSRSKFEVTTQIKFK